MRDVDFDTLISIEINYLKSLKQVVQNLQELSEEKFKEYLQLLIMK